MEMYNAKNRNDKSVGVSRDSDLIHVRAILSCPNCNYSKKFKNQFPRKDLELLTVAVKVFDWMTCNKCGDLLKLDLEFKV